jgi:hypothetical protein
VRAILKIGRVMQLSPSSDPLQEWLGHVAPIELDKRDGASGRG